MAAVNFQQSALQTINGARPVVAEAFEWPASYANNPHYHDRAQLVFGIKGIMNVTVPSGTWVVPPQRAVWLPAGMPHVIRTSSAVSLRTLYIDQQAEPRLPTECRVMSVSPLLRELLIEAMHIPNEYPLGGREERLMSVVLDEILRVSEGLEHMHLAEPRDPRVRPIVSAILEDPSDGRTREDWANVIGASSRTIDRIFNDESGMSFGSWKRQAVLMESMRRLAVGQSVTNVALDLGYDSPSAFIAMFRRTLGITPNRLFK